MSILTCDAAGCNSKMCDYILRLHHYDISLYICRECKQRLEDFTSQLSSDFNPTEIDVYIYRFLCRPIPKKKINALTYLSEILKERE